MSLRLIVFIFYQLNNWTENEVLLKKPKVDNLFWKGVNQNKHASSCFISSEWKESCGVLQKFEKYFFQAKFLSVSQPFPLAKYQFYWKLELFVNGFLLNDAHWQDDTIS